MDCMDCRVWVVGNERAGTAAELHRRQSFAENVRLIELRIDFHLPRSVHVAPSAHTHRGQAFRKSLRPVKLRINDGFAGFVHKSPAPIDDHGI